MTSRSSINNDNTLRYVFPNGTLIPSSVNNQSSYISISKVKLLTDGIATLTNGNLTGINSLVANSITANIIIGEIVFPSLNASTALILDASKQLQSSITTSTELSYVHGVTSSIQDQLNSKLSPSNILGTTDEIDVLISGIDATISISDNVILPGLAAVTLPGGTTLERSGGPGSIRFNTDFSVFEATSNGSTWATIETSSTGVVSVSGTIGQIDVSPTTGNCVVSIDSGYIGQTSITTLGTVTTGTWNSTLISPTYGGTGVNNGTSTLTLAGSLTTSGTFSSTFTMTGPTSVTFPTSGTLSTTTGTVTSVSGTTNRITSTGGNSPVIDISSSYVGQTSITTLGIIGTGTWNSTLIGPIYGGTGVNNGLSTLTLAGSLATSGTFSSTFTMTGPTSVTFPTSGTLLSTSSSFVNSVTGTAGEIDVSPTTGNCVVSIDSGYVGQTSITTLGTIGTGTWNGTLISPTYGGTGVNNGTSTLTLAGSLTTSGAFSSTFTMTGPTSVTFPTSGTLSTTTGTVTSVSGTTNRITSTGGNSPVIDISSLYVGQTSITTLGTIGTGTWQGTLIGPTYGGTGVNNGSSTLTLAGPLATSGAFSSTFTMAGPTTVTFPTSGTLATTTGTIPSIGSSTDTAVVTWNGTGGNTVRNNVVLIDSSGDITGVLALNASGTVTGGTLTDGTFSTTGGVVTNATITNINNNVAAKSLVSSTGLVAINSTVPSTGQALIATSATTATWQTISSGAAGTDTEVQYNSGGSFAGNSEFTFNDSNGTLTVGNSLQVLLEQGVTLVGSGTTNNTAGEQGYCVAIYNNIALVGAPNDNNNVGSVWVFQEVGGIWSQVGSKLAPTNHTGQSNFGGGMGINAGCNCMSLIIVGSTQTAIIGGLNDASGIGAAWIFQNTGSGWTFETKITPTGNVGNSRFGAAVSIVETGGTYTAIIGGPFDNTNLGAVWVYTGSGSSWTFQTKIVPTDNVSTSPEFGNSVWLVLNGSTYMAAIGGFNEVISTVQTGATWIYQNTGSSWTEVTKIVPSDNVGNAAFGQSVSLTFLGSTYTLISGGSSDNSFLGAAWIYQNGGSGWTEIIKLTPTNNIGAPSFGRAVSIYYNTTYSLYYVAVGGITDNSNMGAVWTYQSTTGSSWTALNGPSGTNKFVPVNITAGNVSLGMIVCISGNYLIAGGPQYQVPPTGILAIGSAWTYYYAPLIVTTESGNVSIANTITSYNISDGDGTTISLGAINTNLVTVTNLVTAAGLIVSPLTNFNQVTSPTTTVTVSTFAGSVTTVVLSDAAGASHSFNINFTFFKSTSCAVMLTLGAMSTAIITNGIPHVTVTPLDNGAATITIYNIGTTAFTGSLIIYYLII